MQTQASSASAEHGSAAMMTTDIDLTADLAEPPAAPTTFSRAFAARPPAAVRVTKSEERAPPVEVSDPRLPVAPGRVLRDRYVLTQIIGTGGMCTVFRARDLEASRVSGKPAFVAIKTPRPDYSDRERAIERLKHEFHHAQRLSHLGIVEVFDLACDGDVWFMTMELLEGETLASIMRREPLGLAPHLVRRVLRGIGDALAYAHAAGVAHGDLNPANVFVLKGERIKVIDFGAACRSGDRPTAAATLAYASPQVLDGEAPTIRDDVFSFAAIGYEIITGRHPFAQRPANAAREEALRPDSPEELTTEQSLALMGALSFDRDARLDDIKALAMTLAPDPQRVRTIAFDPEFDLPTPPPQSDKRWWLIAAACAIAMIASVVFTRIA